MALERVLEALWNVFHVESILVAFRRHFGSILGASWLHFGRVLGDFRGLEASWSHLGSLWTVSEATGRLERIPSTATGGFYTFCVWD